MRLVWRIKAKRLRNLPNSRIKMATRNQLIPLPKPKKVVAKKPKIRKRKRSPRRTKMKVSPF